VAIAVLTTDTIRRLIEQDATSERKLLATVGQRYYEGDHDILQYRLFYYNSSGVLVEDKTRSNIKICHPFFTELVDQLTSYMLSFDESPIRAKSTAPELQDKLDEYFDDDFWVEIQELIAGTNSKGFEYIYGYKNVEGRLAFECADSLGVVEVRKKDTDDDCEYIIYWYIDRIDKDDKAIKRIQVFSNKEIWFFVQEDGGSIVLDENEKLNPKPNVVWAEKNTGSLYGSELGFVPFWRLDNNRRQFSGLKPIKALIDDYDLMECGLSNNLLDFDTPIHVVSGFQGDDLDELQTNLKTKKIIGVDDSGGLEVRTVDIPYQARKIKADEDEKNIYRFGMGFNSSQVGDGNVTNVVIRSRYTLLELKAKKLEGRLKKLLRSILRVVLDEINIKYKTAYQTSDVQIQFDHIIPTNESETAQNAYVEAQTQQLRINSMLQAAAIIGDEAALRAICDVLDLDFDSVKEQANSQKEAEDFLTAQNTLKNVVPEDGNGNDSSLDEGDSNQ
jgi:SPP1 family phage portal protein